MVEEEKLKIGKKGVMAKRAAIDRASRDIQKAGKEIHKEGVERMAEGVKQMTAAVKEAVEAIEAGVGELQSAIQAQVKENEEAVANIGKGTQQVLSSAKKLGNEFKRYRKEEFSAGIQNFWYG